MPLPTASSLLPSMDSDRNVVRDAWDRLHDLPGGKAIFSRLIGAMAPYTGTIGARVVDLAHGRSRVALRDRRRVRNHLRSIHAVALANLAELTGNLAVAYTLPDDARFIVAGMNLDYVKKARGLITGECEVPPLDGSTRKEYQVPVVLRDEAGDEVVRATLRTLVGPKKAKAQLG